MFCERCGAQLPDTADFCTNCGANIVKNAKVAERNIPDTEIQLKVKPTFYKCIFYKITCIMGEVSI